VAYLNYAGMGILSARTRQELHEAVDRFLSSRGTAGFDGFDQARQAARDRAAALLGCLPEEVAFVPNTGAGLHLVAGGLDWRPGDEVVLFDRDFPANVQPWLRLAGRGVVPRWVPMRDGGYDLADVARTLTARTRLVAVSHVSFLTGFRLDLARVCELARGAGALVCVDAAQSAGALPVSLAASGADFLAAGGHKWLCGPPGSGLFACRAEVLDRLPHAPFGWTGYEGARAFMLEGEGRFTYDLSPKRSARRFESGAPSVLAILGLGRALADLTEAGMETVSRRVLELAGRLRREVAARGYLVAGPGGPAGEATSGIVTFAHPSRPNGAVVRDLARRGIVLGFPDGMIRASAHAWTSDEEIDELLDALPAPGPG
jgi:cysteine desulfurase / selenocysteine lyase